MAIKKPTKTQHIDESTFLLRWRHGIAYIFILICFCDFLVMPLIYEITNKIDVNQAVQLSLQFKDPASQTLALQTLMSKRVWDPLTLKSNGMFFMAFGSILGVAAWSRGQENISRSDMFGNQESISQENVQVVPTNQKRKPQVDNPDN